MEILVWVYELGKQAKSGDLLAFLISENKLIVINCSNSTLSKLENFLVEKMKVLSFVSSPASDELLSKLKKFLAEVILNLCEMEIRGWIYIRIIVGITTILQKILTIKALKLNQAEKEI